MKSFGAVVRTLDQAPVVQKDSADNAIGPRTTCPLESEFFRWIVLSNF